MQSRTGPSSASVVTSLKMAGMTAVRVDVWGLEEVDLNTGDPLRIVGLGSRGLGRQPPKIFNTLLSNLQKTQNGTSLRRG